MIRNRNVKVKIIIIKEAKNPHGVRILVIISFMTAGQWDEQTYPGRKVFSGIKIIGGMSVGMIPPMVSLKGVRCQQKALLLTDHLIVVN